MNVTLNDLDNSGACRQGAEWARTVVGDGIEFDKLITKFERADWLIWALNKAEKINWKQAAWLACAGARTALKFVPKNEDRPKKCIEVTEAYLKGKATIEEVRNARRASYSAYAAAAYAVDAAAAYAVDAVDAAAYAAEVAAYAYAAYAYAAQAAEVAAYAYAAYAYAAQAAAAAARKKQHKLMCAVILRELKKKSFKNLK